MDLPDCPPGAEGYEDTVTEVPKKPEIEDPPCTKAELEFQEHLNSLKIRIIEDGSMRCMVERRARDLAGKWIYLCYPCAAMCSGETVLQGHLSGKKHKAKLSLRNEWPVAIYNDHPFHQLTTVKAGVKRPVEENEMFAKYTNVICHIQESLDTVKAPLIGVEYLIEHPPEQDHYEPTYMCTLCVKQGHPRTIINHMTCFWHRYNYLLRHFPSACALLTPFRAQAKYREGVGVIMNRLAQRIEDKYGRKRPINIEKEEYEKNKDLIHQWIFRGHHFSEKDGSTFEEVVDIGLIDSLHKADDEVKYNNVVKSADERKRRDREKELSPPTVAAPAKPLFNSFSVRQRPAGRQERRAESVESLSDISDEGPAERREPARHAHSKDRHHEPYPKRYEPYPDKRRLASPPHNRHSLRKSQEKQRAPNYEYKLKLAEEKRLTAEDSAKKTLAYHEKNPEKHPLYPEEWKKFWNRRYKEIQAEGKDPSKHDFKPEWIVFWTARMKDLHEEELRVQVNEIYRKMCLSPPDMSKRPLERAGDRRRSADRRRPDRHARPRASDSDYKRDRRRSPPHHVRRSPGRSDRRRSPARHKRSRSRSPIRRRSPARTHIALESLRRSSRSPLSKREGQPRNRSPEHSRSLAPSMQTVLISDDELKPDDGLSPWNSDNDIESVLSGPSAASQSGRSAPPRRAPPPPSPGASPDDVVATLRLLVALEDYLGSLGPRVVDLLADALKMEKERANSSEELLEREAALVLLETAKEKLKGAAQAGLVAPGAAAAVRAAVVRVAATLHEADKRLSRRKQESSATAAKPAAVPVAGVGEVDRAQIAQQMAAALIAQGKTDVSSEELAQLVDAVVGMAEAKKRETEKKKDQQTPAAPAAPVATKLSGTASALQMLQSAYDENDKKTEKDDVPDAMDGLSDSDLETLLKNFNELSAEEQHSLIAYLKKLEAKEPQRVERLRQYVSDAAATAPPAAPPAPSAPPAAPAPAPAAPLVLDSDDDDYTVEEVFQSATQKVKEDQIRQEMEIVKKSLEEVKPPDNHPTTLESSLADITKNLSSATDLFALVQASLKSTPTASHAPLTQSPGVVVSTIQPRSFGDLSEAPAAMQQPMMSLLQNAPMQAAPIQTVPVLPSPPQNIPMTPASLIAQNLPVGPTLLMTPNQTQLPQNPNSFHNQQGALLRPPIRHQAVPQQQLYQQQHFQPQGQLQHQHQQQQQQHQHQQQHPQQQHQQHQQQQHQHQQHQQQQHQQHQQQQHQQQQHQQHQQQHQQQQQYKPAQNQQQYHNQQQQDHYQHNNFNDNRNKPNDHHQPWNQRNNNMSDNRGPSIRGTGPNIPPFNQGPRNNFMNGREQDNYDTRPQIMNNQFGGFDNQHNNFRGRGRGHPGGMRGRGRGYY
ncbi:LOW QUALITY PROTEIN: uncharacterized protein CG7065-like [Trichoplusia ni]|uniref:non-specific serine/threonine protein kinase n=1 Tax=Trichoplusia ni TaxID=7111 RepID=A0A7E5VDN2_TRINI|nr:LOW QUALITY PROTEIN: uncharacterized protein CG7065-like [Trichoplusia ni]